jgi:hypothetical protein
LGGEDRRSEILVDWKNHVQRITQISVGLFVLQSTTCSRTVIEPWSRWARGAAFWADNEAKVQIAPSGMMKKRKDGLAIFSLLCGVGIRSGDHRFSGSVFPGDVVDCFICFVSCAFDVDARGLEKPNPLNLL